MLITHYSLTFLYKITVTNEHDSMANEICNIQDGYEDVHKYILSSACSTVDVNNASRVLS